MSEENEVSEVSEEEKEQSLEEWLKKPAAFVRDNPGVLWFILEELLIVLPFIDEDLMKQIITNGIVRWMDRGK